MTSCFLDTNILLDWAIDRKPFSDDAFKIVELAETGVIEAQISAASLFTLSYFVRKSNTMARTVVIMQQVISLFGVLPTMKRDIQSALNSKAPDLEDAYQYFTALSNQSLDYFITRDEKHYSRLMTKLPVISPGDFLKVIEKK